ncbi:hypothetical protein PC122_g18705 [Phytophthora cactorum]|nr:hypothetical protein PC122_g18705 [Phytophthora cactorum]
MATFSAAVGVVRKKATNSFHVPVNLDVRRMMKDPAWNEWFKLNLRCSQRTFELLCKLLEPHFPPVAYLRYNFETGVACTLFHLASSDSYRETAAAMGVSKACTSTPPQETMAFTIIVSLFAKDGKDVEEQLRTKLVEAAQTFSKYAGVLGRYPMQNASDSRKWTIVERYDQKSSVAEHRENPDIKAFADALLELLENGKGSLSVHQFKEL